MEGINMSLKPIDPKTLELNPFTTIGTEWMLLTAGNEDKHNTMTVSWGGLGVLWRKNVTYVLVRPQRYTMEFMDREEYYSLCVFDETYKPALKLCGPKSGRDIDKDKETGLTVMFDQEAPYYAEAKLVFICKKMSKQKMEPSSFIDSTIDETFYKEKDYHEVFVGDIVTILKQD